MNLPPSTRPPPPLPNKNSLPPQRHVGLWGATGVGVGAIVGGGILVLAGVAFQATGPSAMIAFAINAAVALLTALSFAEMSTLFPENGGAYTFAKKVLSVQAAFGVGWILWFAYIVAGVLYALGFAEYGIAMVVDTLRALDIRVPQWLHTRGTAVALAIAATAYYAVSLLKKSTGGGQWATIGKLIVFVVLIIAGAISLALRDTGEAVKSLRPFFAFGPLGLLQAMGFTFIALQGFDLISAIAGEVKQPSKNIPKSMLFSLGAAIAIYLPLLFIISTVGTPSHTTIAAMSAEHPETVMAVAVRHYMGPVGYWLVMIAAVLSTLSALQANLLAASRVALTMAEDRTLPGVLAEKHPTRATPTMAIYATTLALVAILFMIPDLAAAGAAASLIFLISFALAHGTSILARLRSVDRPGLRHSILLPSIVAPPPEHRPAEPTEPTLDLTSQRTDDPSIHTQTNAANSSGGSAFRTPWFPAVPVIGGIACLLLALFQAVAVPAAGGITVVWLGLGGILYYALFSGRAQTADAYSEAANPELSRLRGRYPLVLAPVANPDSARGIAEVAVALAPNPVGRVLLLSVMKRPRQLVDGDTPAELFDAENALRAGFVASLHAGHRPEALMTVSSRPWKEIARVALARRCESLLLGLPKTPPQVHGSSGQASSGQDRKAIGKHLESLLNRVECDVGILSAPSSFRLHEATSILVPVGGKGWHDELRARLLGSLRRLGGRHVTFLRILPTTASAATERDARRALRALAEDEVPETSAAKVVRSDDVVHAILEASQDMHLVVLGLMRHGGRTLLSEVSLQIADQVNCATMLIRRKS